MSQQNKKFLGGLSLSVMFALVIAVMMPFGQPDAANERNDELRAAFLSAPLAPDLGGEGTVDTTGPRAFRSIMANADNSLVSPFLFGQRNFDIVWNHDPIISPVLDGLGPMFNRTSCRECHEGNGRGHPPEKVGAPLKSILYRLSIPGEGPHGGPNPVPNYGGQLQDKANPGVAPEALVRIEYEEIPGEFADGTPYSLRKPIVTFTDAAYGELPEDLLYSARVASPVIGLGLLDSIPEETLYALADPDDANGDGVSGRVNMVWDEPAQKMMPGRYGWKSNVASLRHQSAGAALGDMGITSPVFPNDMCEEVQTDCIEQAAAVAANANQPEFLEELFTPTVMYMHLLAVPRQRNADDPAVQRGEDLFRGAGCQNCHMPTLETGPQAMFDANANQTIHPFTDLLLHDLGEGLADNRPDFLASGSEWRTAPLWGVGLTVDVGGSHSYLHDGRARSLSEAILWHGGEAEGPREVFRNLTAEQRADLLAFLGSL
jgi:CxxC motif-containing protein (DUF1111 family)